MKKSLPISLPISLLSLLMACSSNQVDDTHVGTTDFHYRDFNKAKFETGSKYKPTQDACINKGDSFDIRLDAQVFHDSFDGVKENFSEGAFWFIGEDKKDTNEIGIFLTVEELTRATDKATFIAEDLQNKQNQINNRLIYTSFSRKKQQPLNQKNKLVYSGIYSGSDLRFILEVREFDQENGQGVQEVIDILSTEASKYTQVSNPIVGGILDKLGNATKTGLFKDDIITAFDMEFVPCGAYKTNLEQIFLAEGQIVFLRHSQNANFSREHALTWDKTKESLSTNKAFTSFSIYKRNPL